MFSGGKIFSQFAVTGSQLAAGSVAESTTRSAKLPF